MAAKRFPLDFNQRVGLKKEDILLVNNSDTGYDEYASIEDMSSVVLGTTAIKSGYPLRLMRNRPTVQQRGVIRASSTANISSTPLSIPISHGCQVESIRIRNKQASTNLTSISVTHNNTGGTSLGTLITGKTVNAGVSTIFVATQLDMVSQETDGTIRILATGNGNEGMDVEITYKVMAL